MELKILWRETEDKLGKTPECAAGDACLQYKKVRFRGPVERPSVLNKGSRIFF